MNDIDSGPFHCIVCESVKAARRRPDRCVVVTVTYGCRLCRQSYPIILLSLLPPPFLRAFLSVQQSRTLSSSTFFFNPFLSSHRLLGLPSS